MTKIKNTKKGMAKKTLSMSLVVAMLATSNVPVWAAEFSDGSDVAVATEAPAEFTDETEAAPVVEDAAEEVSTAQVAEGYTVNTNMELKAGDWDTNLKFAKKDGVTDADKFEVLDKNTVPVNVTKAEIYSGTDLLKTVNVTSGDVVTALKAEKVGLAAYKNSKQVTVKFYVDGNNTAVYEATATVNPVNISTGWVANVTKDTAVYNGKIQTPELTVTKTGYDNAKFVVQFADEKEAKNVGAYKYSVEGVEADGYVGTFEVGTYTITAATPNKDNLSVAVSGTTTYNGANTQPTVVVTDKLTNTVIPSSLYTVAVSSPTPGTYTKDDITVTMNTDNGKTGSELITNNFTGSVPKECNTGSYVINALDLSKLGEKYDITVAAKKVGEEVTTSDFTFVDKTTKKVVAYADALPTGTTIVTSNNSAVGTGKVTIKATDVKDTKITGEYNTTFNVVNATIDATDVSFAKGTKINNKTYTVKTPLGTKNGTTITDNADITAELTGVVYTGAAIEPLKDAFSNLVLTNSATVTDQKLVLGTDYDIIYTDNTNSKSVSGKTATVKLVFKGNYSGTISYTFDIAKATAFVTGNDVEYVAGKTSYEVSAKVVTKSGTTETAIPADAYTVTTTKKATKGINDIAEGVVVFSNKNYDVDQKDSVASAEYQFKNIKSTVVGKNLSKCTASIEGSYVYTGEIISPKLVVKDGNTTLVEGTDYKIINKTGTNAGPAHVTIQGIGNYTGTLTVDYTIAKANLANATVLNAAGKTDYDVAYIGTAVTPDIATVKIGNKVLTKYVPTTKTGDYTITWDDAVEVGTYNFTISAVAGSKNVEGEYKGTFKVTANQLTGYFATKIGNEKADAATPITVDKTGAYYTGSAITIDSFKTKYVLKNNADNKVLTEGKDYELVYTDNVNAGKATVVAYGLGNYAKVDATTGKKKAIASMTYIIGNKATITQDWIQKISDVEYAGGLVVEPTVVVVNPTTKERLTQGKDYTVTTKVTDIYDNAGTVVTRTQADVTIKGLGAYTTTDATNTALSFTKTLNWKVTKKDLANTTVNVDKNNNVTVLNGTVIVPAAEYDVKFSDDKKKVTVTAKADSKYYTGSKEITVESAKVGQAMISNVVVKGNTVTPVLFSEVDEAVGYDYVIATEEDYKNGRVDISKNILKTNTNFYYVQQGTYYAYCHAWKRNEEGMKVFGEWSNIVKFTVTATTPSTPTVKSVKVKGNTVTVTYTVSKDATGYDVILGSAVKTVNGEKRPVDYGTLVKKNIKGNVVTATFTNVPAGKYYAGVHSFNRTSENGSKVFSKWSNSRTVTVK